MQIKYQNNRDIQQGYNFLTNLRPSALPRILRFPFEYSLFQTALTYGIVYNGFGIHSYYMQRTGTSTKYAPWARMKTLGYTFGKYLAVALPFFYLKQVFVSLSYTSTRQKPKLRKTLDHAFLHNLFAMVTTFPIFYHFERNLTKSLRGSLVLGLFAMVNDLYIEKRRQKLILKSYDPDELQRKNIRHNVSMLKEFMEENAKDKRARWQIEQFPWAKIEQEIIKDQQEGKDVQAYRKKQLQAISKAIRAEFKSFGNNGNKSGA